MNQNQLSIRRQCIVDRASQCQQAQSDLTSDEPTVVVFQHAEQTAASGRTDRHVRLEGAVHWTDPPHLRRRTHDRHPRQQLVVAITGSGVEHGPVADGRIDRLLGRHLASRGRVRRHPAYARHEKLQLLRLRDELVAQVAPPNDVVPRARQCRPLDAPRDAESEHAIAERSQGRDETRFQCAFDGSASPAAQVFQRISGPGADLQKYYAGLLHQSENIPLLHPNHFIHTHFVGLDVNCGL